MLNHISEILNRLYNQLFDNKGYRELTAHDLNRLGYMAMPEDKKKALLVDLLFALGYEQYTVHFLGDVSRVKIVSPPPNVIYIEKTRYKDVQRFSVKKEYAEEFTSIYATADDLKLSRLPQNQEECEEQAILKNILSLTASKKLTNTGFYNKTTGKIVDASDLYWSTLLIYRLVSLALLTEFSFGGLQFYYGRSSLVTLLVWVKVAQIAAEWISNFFSSVGSLLDLRLNLKSVSPANDALEAATMNIETDSFWLNAAMTTNLLLSSIAYLAGATGNVRGVLPLILPDKKCPGIDTCMPARHGALALAIFTEITGGSYYLVFGNSSRKAAHEAFGKYLVSPRPDHNLWRNLQIIIEILSNIAFRSVLLASTTTDTLGYFTPMSDHANQNTSLVVTAGVAQDILSSRAIKTVKHWSNPDWAYIKAAPGAGALTAQKPFSPMAYAWSYLEDAVITDTLNNLSYSDIYAPLETSIGIMMTLGAALLALQDNIIYRILGSIGAIILISVNLMSQRNRAASVRIIKSLNEELPERKLQAQRAYNQSPKFLDRICPKRKQDDTHTPLIGNEEEENADERNIKLTTNNNEKAKTPKERRNEERSKRIEVAQRMYAALGSAIDSKITTLDKISIGGSLFIRGAVELTSADVITTIWGLKLDALPLLGLVLLLIPPTLRNFGQMCLENIDGITKQKDAETYLRYRRATQASVPPADDFQTWKTKNWATVFYQTYGSDLGSYTAEELQSALREQAENLGHSFTNV